VSTSSLGAGAGEHFPVERHCPDEVVGTALCLYLDHTVVVAIYFNTQRKIALNDVVFPRGLIFRDLFFVHFFTVQKDLFSARCD
jgi:hypothetical protein